MATMPPSAQTEIFQRTPRNCARAFNLLLQVVLIRAPFAIFIHQFDLTLVSLILVALTLVVAGLIAYLAYQRGLHPLVAILLLVGCWPPFGGFVILLLTLVQSRKYLQRHGYTVGLWSAYEDVSGAAAPSEVPFRKHVPWLIVFGAGSWVLFLLIVIINPEYAGKLFLPFHHWFGPLLLLAALAMSVLSYPLSIEYHRLRTMPKVTVTSMVQLGMVLSLAFLFVLISLGILILGPAAITMLEQMPAK